MKKNGIIANISYGQDGRVCKYKDKEGKDIVIIQKKGSPRAESDFLYRGVSKQLNPNLDILLREAIDQEGITPDFKEDYRKALKLHDKIQLIVLQNLAIQKDSISERKGLLAVKELWEEDGKKGDIWDSIWYNVYHEIAIQKKDSANITKKEILERMEKEPLRYTIGETGAFQKARKTILDNEADREI